MSKLTDLNLLPIPEAESGLPNRLLTRHELYYNIDFEHPYSGDMDRKQTTDPYQAQVISSEIAGTRGERHGVLLDLDVPATLVPSSTPGHSHLYVEVSATWEQYERLLWALADCGVIERPYAEVSVKRKGTHLRLPWVKKQPAAPAPRLYL